MEERLCGIRTPLRVKLADPPHAVLVESAAVAAVGEPDPVRLHEVVALDGLDAERTELLAKRRPPVVREVKRQDLPLAHVRIREERRREVVVAPAFPVMVSENEDALDLLPVRQPVVREHAPPLVHHRPQLAHGGERRQVAGDDDGIDARVAKALEPAPDRPDAPVRRHPVFQRDRDVRIADHAEPQLASGARPEVARRGKRAPEPETSACGAAADKRPPVQFAAHFVSSAPSK